MYMINIHIVQYYVETYESRLPHGFASCVTKTCFKKRRSCEKSVHERYRLLTKAVRERKCWVNKVWSIKTQLLRARIMGFLVDWPINVG